MAVPPVFPWLQKLGAVDQSEMDRVFNMGIGLVVIVAEYFAEAIVRGSATAPRSPPG